MQAKKTGGDFFAWQTCETARRFPYIRINRKKYFSGERTNERQVEFSGRCQQNARYCGQFAVFGKADFSAKQFVRNADTLREEQGKSHIAEKVRQPSLSAFGFLPVRNIRQEKRLYCS